MTPQDHQRIQAEIKARREARDKDGAKRLGISLSQFRALKASALRRDPKVATRAAAADKPRKRITKCFQVVETVTYADGSTSRRVVK